MSKPKIPAALLAMGAISLAAPAIAAPVTPLSTAAKPMVEEGNMVQVRYGGWHGGWGGWHGGAGFAAGALAGALIGGAIAGPYYGGGYYSYGYPAYSYGYPAYSYGYYGYPAYYAPEAYPTREYYYGNPYYRWGG
jgi:hypothetical protein